MKKLSLGVLLRLLVIIACTATAGAKPPSLKSLAKTVAALQKQVGTQSEELASDDSTMASQGRLGRRGRAGLLRSAHLQRDVSWNTSGSWGRWPGLEDRLPVGQDPDREVCGGDAVCAMDAIWRRVRQLAEEVGDVER